MGRQKKNSDGGVCGGGGDLPWMMPFRIHNRQRILEVSKEHDGRGY